MGKKNYKQAYSKYKPNVDFTAYVDYYPDLQNAWKMIEARITGADMSQLPQHNPNLTNEQSADYWIKRMGVDNINNLEASKKAFGQAHAAEDNALMIGKYMGATDFTKGSEAWKDLFTSDYSTPAKPKTRYTDYTTTAGTTTAGTTTAGTTTAGTNCRYHDCRYHINYPRTNPNQP